MKKMSIASLASIAVILCLTVVAWSQNNSQTARITDGPKVKQTTGNSAEIAWSTNVPGSSVVKYGTSANALTQTAEAPWGGTKEPNGDYNHTVQVTNLQPNTQYYFTVETGQAKGTGTEAQSQPQQFHTAAQ